MLTGDLKWGVFRCAELFSLPSHQENFGVAVAEALSCGRPVLLSDKVNIHPWILEAGAGMVETDDPMGVFRLLQGWRSLSAEEKAGMSRAASILFHDRLHISHCVKKFKEAITIVK
jgi:glycosyltransferase involved in cell wall biosynthesis